MSDFHFALGARFGSVYSALSNAKSCLTHAQGALPVEIDECAPAAVRINEAIGSTIAAMQVVATVERLVKQKKAKP